MDVELRVTVLCRDLHDEVPMWGDATGGWTPAAIQWMSMLCAAGVPVCRVPTVDPSKGCAGLLIVPDEHDPLLDDLQSHQPLLLGPPPDDVRDALAAVRDALGALVRPDLAGVLILRLDDPGASVRVHLRSWRHDPVSPACWTTLWNELEAFGRASVFCCPGWVHDDGTVVDARATNPDEWVHLDDGVSRGVIDLECHGYTHLHPDTEAWATASDRHESPDWFREFWPPMDASEPSAEQQAAIIRQWQEACGAGTTLVAPGEAWGLNTIAAARVQGLRLFTSWGVCRLDVSPPVWTTAIESPYLDEADATHFANGLPSVGYWHDRDMALHGPTWVREQLTRWRDCGARRAWAFADLARVYAVPIDAAVVGGEVMVRRSPDIPLIVERA